MTALRSLCLIVSRDSSPAKTPATIDETLEAAEEKLGVTFPLGISC